MMTSRVQLNALIKNQAQIANLSPSTVLRMVLFDLFLEKLSLSTFQPYFILKGGFLIAALTNIALRSTVDLDVSLRSFPLQEKDIEKALTTILAIPTLSNLTMKLVKLETIQEGNVYEGLRATIHVSFDGLKEIIKVDMTTGDAMTPSEMDFEYLTLLQRHPIRLKSYNVQTILSEKIETILIRAQGTTRMRDFYDLYILWHRFESMLHPEEFRQAFINTSIHRGTFITIKDNYPITLQALEKDSGLLSMWKRYQSEYEFAKDITWDDVYQVLRQIITKVIFA